jgi:hypothetical protein
MEELTMTTEQAAVQGKELSTGEKLVAFRVAQVTADEVALEEKNEEIKQLKLLTLELFSQLATARRLGAQQEAREIRNEIVVKNMRLVTVTLQKYGSFSPDKFQNGCVGLLKAAETFDIARNVPFASYACFCIETEVRAAWSKQNRAFEGKKAGFLDSLDEVSGYDDSKETSRYESVQDPYGESDIDQLLQDAEVDTLFYKIIIPSIEEYGVRSKDIDVTRWRELEIQYFMELSMVKSQRQRLTLSSMAKELGTVTQNLRIRHKKVMELIRQKCLEYGYAEAFPVVKEGKKGKVQMVDGYKINSRGHSAWMKGR